MKAIVMYRDQEEQHSRKHAFFDTEISFRSRAVAVIDDVPGLVELLECAYEAHAEMVEYESKPHHKKFHQEWAAKIDATLAQLRGDA